MTHPAVHASPNAPPAWLEPARQIAVPCAAALFLAFTDAFGLDVLPLGPRLLYWLVLLGLGQAGSLVLRTSLDRLQLSPPRLVLAGILRSVLLSLPVSAVVWAVTAWALSEPLRAGRLPQFYFPTLVIIVAMVGVNLLVQRRPYETHASPRLAHDAPQPAPILARLPPRLRTATLYAVQAEDHYVRFHTSAGSDLVLLRFADALRELRGLKGAQVHRSWWVARDAVAGARREEGKLFLLLPGGARAPVSRTFARALRAAGWW